MAETAHKVWRDYTQEELDYNYDQRALVTNFQDYFDRYTGDSARARETHDCRLDVAYGPSADEKLDIFPAAEPNAPVLVYTHGGAWTRLTKSDVSFVAEAFVPVGATTVLVDFGAVPAVTLDEQVRQARAAVAWVWRNARDLGADPDRLYVAGHSSGGHLCGNVIVTDWARDFDLPSDIVKGAMACSGSYDLEPVRLSARNEYLRLDAAAAARLSPLHHIPADGPPLIIGYGGGEHAEFRRQSKEFAAAWRAAGLKCEEFDLPGLNHFDVGFETLEPENPVMKATVALMGL